MHITTRTQDRARLALMLSTAALACATATAQDRGEAFTDTERRALIAGELVQRDLSRREGQDDLYGGASWMRVRTPIDQVWQVASDPRALTRLIPSLDDARVIEERGDTRIVYMHHSFGIGESAYHVRMELDHAAKSLRFRLDPSRPHDIRAGRGFLALTPYRGDTIVEWGMLVDPGAGVIGQLFGPTLNQWLLLPPRCLRDDVEPGRVPSC